MTGIRARFFRYVAGLLVLIITGWMLTVQAARPKQAGIPSDWSHHHVVFSAPSTDAEAAAIMHDPRYWQQWNRDHLARTLNTGSVNLKNGDLLAASAGTQGDWSQNLGNGANAGPGVFPAKYSFQITTATCATDPQPDFVVFSTGLLGSAGQASIVAFDNLYAGCTGTVPQAYWAYDTGGVVLTSPVLSVDGTQIAFVQTSTLVPPGQGVLTLVKWAPSGTESVSAPLTLVPVANSAYRSCTAPCMTILRLRDGSGGFVDDRTSSVFPDYSHDSLWVGGAGGWLHKINGVFQGTPAEVRTGGLPVQVSNAAFTSSPVYDGVSNMVFLGDANGFLYRVTNASPPVVTATARVDFGVGVVAGPIVDSTRGRVYVFSSSDGTGGCTGGAPCTAVYSFRTNFGAGAAGTKRTVGNSVASPGTPSPLFGAGFDSAFLSTGIGGMYVCGNTGGAPTLYKIPVNGGTMGTVVTGPVLSGATTGCSPVTDISNPNAAGGATEWLFASAQGGGLGSNCGAAGCVMNFFSTPWTASHAYTVGQQVMDTHFQIQTCRTAGTSGVTNPAWSQTVGGSTTDGTAQWRNQGKVAAVYGSWQAGHAYTVRTEILDPNGNIQEVSTAGTSGASAPSWSTTIDALTNDGPVRWRNIGSIQTASISAAGGTGGIILDNVVGSGTMSGASQIYFSTQSNQTCGTSGTGGCAVQASQSGLN